MSVDVSALESALAAYAGGLLDITVSAGGIPATSASGYAMRVAYAEKVGFLEPPSFSCEFLAKQGDSATCVKMCDELRSKLPKFGVSAGNFSLFYVDSDGDSQLAQASDRGVPCWTATLRIKVVVKP